MRITRDLLLNTAKDTIQRLIFEGHDLVCAYLTGSLIDDQPLLGGMTDIDLVYVHSLDVPCHREIVTLTDEIHLDIAHLPQSYFSQPRKLRTDAWVGAFLCHGPLVLYDSQHWFEYTQAGVYAHFFQPSNVIERVKSFSERARSGWMALKNRDGDFTPVTLLEYLKVLKDAANAISSLSSVPLTERRFMVDFAARTFKLQKPGLTAGFLDLILAEEPVEPNWDTWLENWRASHALLLAQPEVPVGLSHGRLPYYESAILELQSIQQEAALWILLFTWTKISSLLPQNAPELSAFVNFSAMLGLNGSRFAERLALLDTYLDTLEEIIDDWSFQNGL